jgi:hypothetical protein
MDQPEPPRSNKYRGGGVRSNRRWH